MKDYYSVVNVSREATNAEIRKLYLHFAREWHPDKNPGNEDFPKETYKKTGG